MSPGVAIPRRCLRAETLAGHVCKSTSVAMTPSSPVLMPKATKLVADLEQKLVAALQQKMEGHSQSLKGTAAPQRRNVEEHRPRRIKS